MAVIKCNNCKLRSLQRNEGPCADCFGFSEWRYNPVSKEKEILIDLVRRSIITSDIRSMTIDFLENKVPPYFWIIPASSTGKYHPQYSLGIGGVARHTIAALKILIHMLQPESMVSKFTLRQIDCMLSAITLHDTFKCGTQEEYENDPPNEKGLKTKDDHELRVPILGGQLTCNSTMSLSLIQSLIATHMGQWGSCKPCTEMEILVHLADYLASRKDIEVNCE